MNSTEVLLQKTEADILESFERFGTQFNIFSDVAHQIVFSPENSEQVRSFFKGLDALQKALFALVEATKVIAEIKGVEIS